MIQTSQVSGASSWKSFNVAYFAFEIASLMKYDTSEVTIMSARMAKSHTMSFAPNSPSTPVTPSVSAMNTMSATPVTP